MVKITQKKIINKSITFYKQFHFVKFEFDFIIWIFLTAKIYSKFMKIHEIIVTLICVNNIIFV